MKKLFATTLAMLMAVFVGAAVFVACDGGGGTAIKYSVKVNCDSNGSYTLDSSDGQYAEGSKAKLTITPNAGYELDAVQKGSSDITEAVKEGNNVYEFEVNHSEEFTVSFKKAIIKYSVKVTCDENGSYTLNNSKATYNDGAEVKLTITPKEGYIISSVKDGDNDITQAVLTSGGKEADDEGQRKYKFNIDSDKHFTIAFEIDNVLKVKVRNYNSELGSIEVSPQKEFYDLNEKVTITATLKSDEATAGRFWISDENLAKELNEERTLTRTVNITHRLTIDAYFDNWCEEAEISAKDEGFMDKINDMINQELVLVDFNATGCPSCRAIAPAIENFSKLGLAKVISFNVAPEGDMVPVPEVESYMLPGFPTVVAFSYGEELKLYACKSCNPAPQKWEADSCKRIDESSLAQNSWVIAVECPDKCPKCGKASMDAPLIATCSKCKGFNTIGYSSDISLICPYCRVKSVWAISMNRAVGEGASLTTTDQKIRCQYLCEVLGLDPALVK